MPHSSTMTGTPPSDVTASTIVRQPCSWASATSGCGSLSAPVDVSACTKATMRASGCGRQRRLDLSHGDRGAPVVVDHDRYAARALHVLDHAPAEGAVAADDHLVARLDEVDEARLHADGARTRHRKRDLVRRLEGVAQELLELLHHPHELGVEVTDRGTGHGLQDPGRHVGGSGPHEGPNRRFERREMRPVYCHHDPSIVVWRCWAHAGVRVVSRIPVRIWNHGGGIREAEATMPDLLRLGGRWPGLKALP